MGILSYFGKQTYTLYIEICSGYFEDYDDPELHLVLDYQGMYMHENRQRGSNGYGGVDYDDLPRLINPPIRKVIKTSSDLLALSKIADAFNEEQANDLYYRISQKIKKGNLCNHNSSHPFPIKFRFDNNVLGYPEDYETSKWDDWYWSGY